MIRSYNRLVKPEEVFMKFEFYNPVHSIFGAGTLSQLGAVVHKNGKKAVIVTGGGNPL